MQYYLIFFSVQVKINLFNILVIKHYFIIVSLFQISKPQNYSKFIDKMFI